VVLQRYIPAAPLRDLVEDFWLYDGYRPRHLRERILPSGTVELVINLRDDELRIHDRVRPGGCERFSGAVVSGAYRRFFVIDTAEEASLLGVHFRPGGALPFVGRPVGELVDAHVDLEVLWGRAGRELRERLCGARRPIDRFRILEAALRTRLAAASPHAAMVRFAAEQLGGASGSTVRAVRDQVSLSHRRFIEVFARHVGLTPKRFHRIQRFQRILRRVQQCPADVDWGDLAAACGFFDQSHLIRDCAELSGFRPAELARHLEEIARRGIHLKRHHLPLLARGQVSPRPAGAAG
jgi:methylphosphotriester-DNA--protein-cysteine methyltransferase